MNHRLKSLGIITTVIAVAILSTGCLGGPPRGSGVFATRDSGTSWQPVPDLEDKKAKKPKVWPPLEVTAVGVSSIEPNTIVAGTDEDLYKSTDAGKNWEKLSKRLPTGQAVAVQVIAWHPTEKDTWYVGGVSAGYGKVLKTTDGGQTFKDLFTGSKPSQAVTSLLIDPSNAQTIYAGDQLGSIFRSTDGATSWKRTFSTTAPVSSLVSSGNSIFAGTAGQGVFRSTDSGNTFTPINGNLVGGGQTVWSLATGLGSLFAGTDEGLFATKDFGATWQAVGNPLPPNGQRVQATVVSNGHVYFATNAVVYQGSSAGDNFVPVQLRLAENVFSLAASRTDTSVLYAGANAKADFANRYNRGLPQLIKLKQ